MKKNYALTLNLILASSFSLQARTVADVVQMAKDKGVDIRKAIGHTRIFRQANSGITSLEGLNTVPNSEGAWVLDLSGNDLRVIKKNSFKKYPNLKYLDLSGCNIKEIESGAFDGLPNLYVLRLEDNQLQRFDWGDFKGTKPTVLTINNNPNPKKLKTQAQRQLPKTTVVTGTLTLEAWRNILAAAGLLALLGGILYFAAPKKEEGITTESPGLVGHEEIPLSKLGEVLPTYPEIEEKLTPGQRPVPVKKRAPEGTIPPGWVGPVEEGGLDEPPIPTALQRPERIKPKLQPSEPEVPVEGGAGTTPQESVIFSPHEKPTRLLIEEMTLMAAIKKNDLDEVEQLLNEETLVQLNDNRRTTLMVAVEGGNEKIINLIIEEAKKLSDQEKENFLDAQDYFGTTALIRVVNLSDTKILELLIQEGAGVNVVDNLDRTPLIHAVINGKPEMVRLLKNAKADISLRDEANKAALDYANELLDKYPGDQDRKDVLEILNAP